MGKIFRKIAAAVLSCTAALSCVSGFAGAEKTGTAPDFSIVDPADEDIISYSRYRSEYSGSKRPDSEIRINADDFISEGFPVENIDGRNALVWEDSGDSTITCRTEIPETGIYCLEISYFSFESGSGSIELSMSIDGGIPYDTASRLSLSRVWANEDDMRTDSRGNQIRPAQIQQEMWQKCFFGDSDGMTAEPLFFYLEKGTHEISFTAVRAEFAIEYMTFRNPPEIPSYSEYRAQIQAEDNASGVIRIEAENAVYKSDPSIALAADNSSYMTSPSDPVKIVYNTLGGGNWKKALQWASWEITPENSGWYRIGIKARQNQMRGFCSGRRIYIDGEIPCRELEQVNFFYDTDWNLVVPQTESGEDVYIYLEAGRTHTIAMECVIGETGEFLSRLSDTVSEINRYYRRIVMITGASPDRYTDYYVQEKIPELLDEFSRISAELREIQNGIESLSGTSGSEAAVLENMAVILEKCTKKPRKIPDYLSQIKDSITTVSAWLRDCCNQPLEADYIELAAADSEFSECREEFGKSLAFGLKSFFGSFSEDYTTLSDVSGDDEVLEVWVALGREQAQAVSELVESRFVQEYGIPVSVRLVSGGIIEASLAGKGPDAALFLGGEFPVNLAARGMLADISEYNGFGEVTERFQQNAMTPYEYNDGTYGLPISQTFPMMFYRTDILPELGYSSPPETWTELIDMLPAIQRSYMNVGLVLPSSNVSPAVECGHTFAMLLLQKGVNYYNDTMTESSFDSDEAVQSFEEWTDFYTKYSFEQSYDPFSRFRTGEYPIVIADYTFYNQLAAAAPEIKGLWDFCPVPGTLRDDGTVSHAANSTGTGAVIFSSAENKEDAWNFIKWFTEADTQAEYGRLAEGLLGIMGRFDTANTEALARLSWSPDELERLYAQQNELVEIPITPSSYAVTRNIMNAFRETVNEGENPRDTLIWYNRDINEEITRKNGELESRQGSVHSN